MRLSSLRKLRGGNADVFYMLHSVHCLVKRQDKLLKSKGMSFICPSMSKCPWTIWLWAIISLFVTLAVSNVCLYFICSLTLLHMLVRNVTWCFCLSLLPLLNVRFFPHYLFAKFQESLSDAIYVSFFSPFFYKTSVMLFSAFFCRIVFLLPQVSFIYVRNYYHTIK